MHQENPRLLVLRQPGSRRAWHGLDAFAGLSRLGCRLFGGGGMSAITPNFAGEMQLAGWSESHTGGCKVTFWLQGPDDLAPFRALTVRKGNQSGHRFMAALVEVGDDEMPVQPEPVADMGNPITEKPKGGALAKLAGMWCNDWEFTFWLRSIGHSQVTNFSEASRFVRSLCGVGSRSELDHDPVAAEKFNRLIRGPYSKHLIARGITA